MIGKSFTIAIYLKLTLLWECNGNVFNKGMYCKATYHTNAFDVILIYENCGKVLLSNTFGRVVGSA